MKAVLKVLPLLILSACGVKTDFAQRLMVFDYDKEPIVQGSQSVDEGKKSQKEEVEEVLIINPPPPSQIITPPPITAPDLSPHDLDDENLIVKPDEIVEAGASGNSLPPEPTELSINFLQNRFVRLSDGRQIEVNLGDSSLDNERLQIRKVEDLVYKGLHIDDNALGQVGLVRDEKTNRIYPVALVSNSGISNNIPEGGLWEGAFYGEFEGETGAYDVFGKTRAQVDLVNDRIDGNVRRLFSRPADTTERINPLSGTINFEGNIQDGIWQGTANSERLVSPETGRDFKEVSGITQGAFLGSAEDQQAREAVGNIQLLDESGKGLVGVTQIYHNGQR